MVGHTTPVGYFGGHWLGTKTPVALQRNIGRLHFPHPIAAITTAALAELTLDGRKTTIVLPL